MNISNITPPQVWTNSARSLTNIGSGALAAIANLSTAIAASSSVDLRPSAGTVGQITVGVITGPGATGATGIAIYDGTNSINLALTAAAANSPAAFTASNLNTSGIRLTNTDAAVAGRYQTASLVWTI